MALVLKDRVKETTTTTGTGTITLLGASSGFQSFSAIGNANTTYYTISAQTGSEWEVGIGTYTSSGTTLSRDTILASSNAGSAVNFSAGTKDVFVTYPAGKSVNADASGNVALASSFTTYVQAIGDASYPGIYAQGGTNTPLVLQPLGTGALQAQKTDSTATGGNARGANAVDWQTSRNLASQVASGTYAFIGGGGGNAASGFNATIAGGNSNVASNNYAFVGGGLSNNAGLGMSGIVAGYGNQAVGYLNFVGGGYANSATTGTAVTTQSATMNGTTAVTLSGSNANIKVGQLIIGTSINSFPYTYVAAISGTSLTLSQVASGSSTSTLSFFTPHGVVVGGGNNQATGSYSFIGGGGDAGTAANRNVASGAWSTVVGGFKNTSSGQASYSGGGYGNTSSGLGSVIVGGGLFGTIENSQFATNSASGTSSFIGAGFQNFNSGYAGTIAGGYGNTVNSNWGVASGSFATTRSITNLSAFGAYPFGQASGACQSGLLMLGVQTTNATPAVVTSDGSAASSTNQVILPNNSAYYFKGTVVAGVTGGGNTAAWSFEGTIKRGANAASTTLVGTPVLNLISQDAGASTWVLALTADTTNGGLAVTFTGQASTTIRAVAKVETTEMTY